MAEDLQQRLESAGIYKIEVPTPFAIGDVSCYLIDDDPLTLIDTGPNVGDSLDVLDRKLRDLGRPLHDVKRIVLTHQHIDHLGLIGVLSRRIDAELVTLDLLAPFVADFTEQAEPDDRMAAKLMIHHGVPKDVVTALRVVARTIRAWGAESTPTGTLQDGGKLEFANRTLTVLHRPGHSPSDTIFWDPNEKLMLAGDHLLPKVSSNPLIHRPIGGITDKYWNGRAHSLRMYRDSLLLTKDLDIELVAPGHGELFSNHRKLIDERFENNRRRAERLYDLLTEPKTAYRLAQDLWGTVAITQAYFTICEVLGHLDLLLEEGRIIESVNDSDIALFEQTN